MDVITHLLIGEALALPTQSTLRDNLIVALFSLLPDTTQIPLYLHIGFINKRWLWFPRNSDWLKNHFRNKHPAWSALWEIPHSIIFFSLVIVPLVVIFDLPKMAAISYFSHIFVDLFTHTTEWGVKPFYPFNYKFKGFTDVWSWRFSKLAWLWTIFGILVISLKLYATGI